VGLALKQYKDGDSTNSPAAGVAEGGRRFEISVVVIESHGYRSLGAKLRRPFGINGVGTVKDDLSTRLEGPRASTAVSASRLFGLRKRWRKQSLVN